MAKLYVGPLGLKVHYLSIYWTYGLSRKQGSTRGGDVLIRRDYANK